MRYLGDQKLVFCLHFFAWNVGPPGLWHCYATAVDTINEVSQDQSDHVISRPIKRTNALAEMVKFI